MLEFAWLLTRDTLEDARNLNNQSTASSRSVKQISEGVDLTSANGMASGYLDDKHIAVNKYLFLFSDSGNGPTISTFNLENTSEIIGTSFKGAFLVSPGLPTIWQE
ncbi:unnamed protein product [Larinioides sclopetarius]|uniref:Uncharacterized protein n=1 Tax=Larinioides sclopetarius TaxID=280406 RepID=A0AAV2BVG7_9ARAC